MSTLNFKRYFLIALVISLILSAVVGIYVFLVSDFGDIENKILLTTVGLAVFSLLGLCSALIYGKEGLSILSSLGMAFSFLGFLGAVNIVWQQSMSSRGEAEILLMLTILSFSIAHVSLLLLLKINNRLIRYSLYSTLVFIILVASMLTYVVIFHYDEEGIFFRILGVFAILDVLGSIITPLLQVIKSRN